MGKFNIYVCVIKLGGKRSEEKRLLLIVGVATILLGACSENKPTKQNKEQKNGNNRCKNCVDAKEWLQENSIPFIMKDVADEGNLQQFRKYNDSIIPVLIIKDYKQK